MVCLIEWSIAFHHVFLLWLLPFLFCLRPSLKSCFEVTTKVSCKYCSARISVIQPQLKLISLSNWIIDFNPCWHASDWNFQFPITWTYFTIHQAYKKKMVKLQDSRIVMIVTSGSQRSVYDWNEITWCLNLKSCISLLFHRHQFYKLNIIIELRVLIVNKVGSCKNYTCFQKRWKEQRVTRAYFTTPASEALSR